MTTKLCAILALFCVALHTHAQSNTGVVNYELVTSFDLHMENMPADLAALLPKENKSDMVLYFTETNSLYENSSEPERKESEFSASGANSSIKFEISTEGNKEKTYTDLVNGKSVEQKDFMGKAFLISGGAEKLKWKITGRQKMLLNYALQEATAIKENDTITAWYTAQIPVAAGPMGINGLPGLVLEASIGSTLKVTATSVKAGEEVSKKIKEPTKGKKVTPEAFKKIVKEKEAELKSQHGGDGVHINQVIVR